MKRKLVAMATVLGTAGLLAGTAAAKSSPAVVTGSHEGITVNQEALHGRINAEGSDTTYMFQYGLTTAYGNATPIRSAGHGTKAKRVTANAVGLIPGTVYHYRLVALNRFGETFGADRHFKSLGNPPPGVVTGPATQISQSGATLTGVVNPNSQATTWQFQYGTTPALGSSTFAQALPAGSQPQTVSKQLFGLASGTTFYYRLVGSHPGSAPSFGAVQSFPTQPAVPVVPQVNFQTTPHHAFSQPYTFTTHASLAGFGSIPNQYACSGIATIHFFTHHRQVGTSLAFVQPDCSFSFSNTFNSRPLNLSGLVRLKVRIHYRGNGYLAATDSNRHRNVLG